MRGTRQNQELETTTRSALRSRESRDKMKIVKQLQAAQQAEILTPKEASEIYRLHLEASQAPGNRKRAPKRLTDAFRRFNLFVAKPASMELH